MCQRLQHKTNMAVVYKQHQSLWFIPLLMIMLLFDFNLLTSATKARIRRREYSDSQNGFFEFFHKLRKRKVQLDLPHKPSTLTVKAQTWTTITFHCNLPNIEKQNITLSWSKKLPNNEYFTLASLEQIFVVNETSTTPCVGDDKRYLVKLENNDWRMHIRYTLITDAGMYQCKICYNVQNKCTTTNVLLKLTEAHAKIIGGPTKVIPKDKELPLRLSCVLINSMEKPDYIFWYHGDRMINYDLEDGSTVREGPQGSELIFQKANKTHVGNYSCVPSNAKLDSVVVYYGEDGSEHPGDGSGTKETQNQHYIIHIIVLTAMFLLIY